MRLALLLILAGCAAKRPAESWVAAEPAPAYDAPDYAKEDADEREEAPSRKLGRVAAPAGSSASSTGATAGTPAAVAPVADRMIYYNGWVQLRVPDPQESVDQVTALVLGMGGHVETLSGSTLTLRVPVARFQEAFEAVQRLGDVVRRSLRAEDVTESFTATELRLRTLLAERERLVALLAKARTEQEKLSLLNQIQSATEQIDQLQSKARLLQQLADYSRLTVQLEQRPSLSWAGGEDGAAFAWIRALSPFESSLGGKKLALAVPVGLVGLDVKRRFAAESAEGTRLWTDRLVNDPRGDAAFWARAVKGRLATDFASVEEDRVGPWHRLRFVSREGPAYAWWLLLRVDGAKLDVAQVYFPTLADEARHRDAVLASFTAESS